MILLKRRAESGQWIKNRFKCNRNMKQTRYFLLTLSGSFCLQLLFSFWFFTIPPYIQDCSIFQTATFISSQEDILITTYRRTVSDALLKTNMTVAAFTSHLTDNLILWALHLAVWRFDPNIYVQRFNRNKLWVVFTSEAEWQISAQLRMNQILLENHV